MRAVCLTGARFNMRADILHRVDTETPPPVEDAGGHWDEVEDPITGDITKIWVPDAPEPGDDPEAETTFDSTVCIVRGIVEGGVRAAGTTEFWGDIYKNVELVRMQFPAHKVITKRDQIFNIRNNSGQIIWKEEETGAAGIYKATVFEVLGVTPIIGPFGEHIENYALLERSEVQQ